MDSDREVAAMHHRVQVGACRAQPATAAHVAIELGEPFLLEPVDIGGDRVPGLLRGFEKRAEQRVRGRTTLEFERPAVAAVYVVAVGRQAVLHPLEVRQAVGVVPRLHARIRRPALVVERVAPLEDLAVDAGRAAQDLAAGVVDPTAVHERLRLGLVLPVVEAAADRERQRRRHVDEDVPDVIGTAGLQNQHAVRRVGREAVPQGASRGAAPDDHEVVPRGCHLR
jgi:hypothetical protein